MALTRTKWIVLAALVVLVGVAVFVLTSGDKLVMQLSAPQNIIKVEAAGVDFGGWPDMSVNVNGQEIATLTIDTQQRKMFTIEVPNDVGDVSNIEIKFTNDTDCKKTEFNYVGSCTDRALIVRGLYLNDEKLEGGVPSGEKNMASLLRSSEGGITWQIAK